MVRAELTKNWILIHLTRDSVVSGVSSFSHWNHCHDTQRGNRESTKYITPFPGDTLNYIIPWMIELTAWIMLRMAITFIPHWIGMQKRQVCSSFL